MKITNNTIEEFFSVLQDSNSFKNNINIKLPAKLRYALRINEGRLKEPYDAYVAERNATLRNHINEKHCKIENGGLKIEQPYVAEIEKELTELATMENEVDMYLVDKDVMDAFLDNIELSMPEENLLFLMTKGA